MTARVFVFNPFTEGYIACGKAFAPIKHQAMLAEDLANLPQFLCTANDIVLVTKRPSSVLLDYLERAGFPSPHFVELQHGRIDADDNTFREAGILRPWAWGPDSVELFAPLFARDGTAARSAGQYFNRGIAQLYSKAWSADFLRKLLACYGDDEGFALADNGLCSEQEVGVAVDSLEEAFAAIATIRSRGHHKVVVKEDYGLAGHNALRLWEPAILVAQKEWLASAMNKGRRLVVEPWLERELDFSLQLEMGSGSLDLVGYTGLVNDLKGQFLGNWAEPDYSLRLPSKVAAALSAQTDVSKHIQHLYGELFSLLELELLRIGFVGPISIDSFVYRTSRGELRLKPVVEINPRYTMGRVTLELMKRAFPGCFGKFRLVAQAQAHREGFRSLSDYADSLSKRHPLHLDNAGKIRQGAICLNDPRSAQVVLATFEVSPKAVL